MVKHNNVIAMSKKIGRVMSRRGSTSPPASRGATLVIILDSAFFLSCDNPSYIVHQQHLLCEAGCAGGDVRDGISCFLSGDMFML
jgi:hypothetical protein